MRFAAVETSTSGNEGNFSSFSSKDFWVSLNVLTCKMPTIQVILDDSCEIRTKNFYDTMLLTTSAKKITYFPALTNPLVSIPGPVRPDAPRT